MEEKSKIKIGVLSDEKGKILNEALWEMETHMEIEPKRGLISNFIIKNERANKNSNIKKSVYNNNSDVELLDRFVKLHEKEIEKIRKFEI